MTGRTLAFNLARALALGVASIVVAALVWRAQERAQHDTPPAGVDPATSARGGRPATLEILDFPPQVHSDAADLGLEASTSPWRTDNASFLPSSKSITWGVSTDYFLELPPHVPDVPTGLPTDDNAQTPPKQ